MKTAAIVADDFASLTRTYPGSRIIVAGDFLDRSAEPSPAPTVEDVFSAHPTLRQALGEHVTRGGELVLVSGNHDRDVGDDESAKAFARILGLGGVAAGRLWTTPWFFRLGGLHVEHGHVYDPDNAPAHPLARRPTSLGVHFVEAFIAPTAAHSYLNKNDVTPLKLFLNLLSKYGVRSPYIVARFFAAAFSGLAKSGPFFPGRAEGADGRQRLASFAAAASADPVALERLIARCPEPTLSSFRKTLARMYLDRAMAALTMGGSAATAAAGMGKTGVVLGAAGTLAMLTSWAFGADRYRGAVTARLRQGAALVRQCSDAHLVVFGHAHRECIESGYGNTGSFAFPAGAPGRPYLEIGGTFHHPEAIRRYF